MKRDRNVVIAEADRFEETLERKRRNALRALCAVLGVGAIALLLQLTSASPVSDQFTDGMVLAGSFGIAGAIALLRYRTVRLACFREFANDVASTRLLPNSAAMREAIDELERRADGRSRLQATLAAWMPTLEQTLEKLSDSEIKRDRAARVAQLCEEADRMVKAAVRRRHEAQPEVNARIRIEAAIKHLRHLVSEADRQFDEALDQATLKWWHQLTRNRGPLVEIEDQIVTLEQALVKLMRSPSLVAADADYLKLQNIIDGRIAAARKAACDAIPDSHRLAYEPDQALKVGMIAGAASIPISIAADIDQAGSIYDALREVNGNFAGMSDLEIWHETLSMPAESLGGLASLTKGAYFEQLVESDFGGERFVNFNHPDTDIVIDGVAYQIKATDSAAYVDSVADHIPVIATSEVAEQTGAIDGGFTDIDLSNTVELALGGPIIDFGDTVLDGLSTGLGGVGLVAIVRGTHSAWQEYVANGDAADALGIGVRTTAVTTARSFVNIAEVVVRGTTAVVTSRPAKALGRRFRDATTEEHPSSAPPAPT